MEVKKDIYKEYILMHKNIPLCLVNISDEGVLKTIRKNENNSAHFPLGGQMNDMKFHDWWKDRAIPETRNGAKNALEKLGYPSTSSALVNNLALSLTDCYWIKPRGSTLKWEDVNLFNNDFEDAFGELTINKNASINLKGKTKFNSATSTGELAKKWCIAKNGQRLLVKGNYGLSYQQSINEVFASNLYKTLGFKDYVKYNFVSLDLENGNKGLGCYSLNVCSNDVEMISAWEILQQDKIKNNQSFYYPFKSACLKLGMLENYFDDFIDRLILTDYLLTNTDRHFNNISILRNPDTLKLIGFAPIYDSGNSMFYNYSYDQLLKVDFDKIKTHFFVESEKRLLKYVKNFNCINLDNLNMDFSIYEKDIKENHIKIPLIRDLFYKKVDIIKKLQVKNR